MFLLNITYYYLSLLKSPFPIQKNRKIEIYHPKYIHSTSQLNIEFQNDPITSTGQFHIPDLSAVST